MEAVPALEIHGLRKSYGGVVAVRSLDLEVGEGTVLGFLGPNGAGKTTVIRMLSTVLRPDAGSFRVAGAPSTAPAQVRRLIGVLPESAGYPAGQTGEEWLTYHAQLFGQRRVEARTTAQRLLAEVGLEHRGRTAVSTYSRGMRQRLGVARALVNRPRLVILDEPTLGLDPSGQRRLLDLVAGIARDHGVTVLLSTHLLAEVEETCDQVLILHRGVAVAQGTVAEVVRAAAAPRRCLLRVPAQERDRALAVFADGPVRAVGLDGRRSGDLELTLPTSASPEDASSAVLARLLDHQVPVLGFSLEGGRLSDAFLAVTEERTP